jgi:hypothetical protein
MMMTETPILIQKFPQDSPKVTAQQMKARTIAPGIKG